MATSCQDVIARAVAFSALNAPLATDAAELCARVAALQQQVWTATVAQHRDPFQTVAAVTTTGGAAGRTVAFADLARPLERLLEFRLVDGTARGTEVTQVDPLDLDAELAPRYVVTPDGIAEVDGDWGPAGARAGRLRYCYAPTPIAPAGGLTQAVSLPDAWADLLVLPLAQYLYQKDPGRDPAEGDRLAAMRAEVEARWDAYLTHRGGVEARRFVQPTPAATTGGKA